MKSEPTYKMRVHYGKLIAKMNTTQGTQAWIYRDSTLTLPRVCEYTGGFNCSGEPQIIERGCTLCYPSKDLYPTREDAIKAREITIRNRIKYYNDRITSLQTEVHTLVDMLPENNLTNSDS